MKTLNEHPECKDFMSSFLGEMGRVTGVTPYSNDIVKVFDRLAKLSHIYSNRNTGALAWAAGSAGSVSAYIIFDFGTISKFVSLFIPTTLHELTHAAPGSDSPGYSHAAMDQAAYNVLSKRTPNLGPFDPKRSYFANYLEAHNLTIPSLVLKYENLSRKNITFPFPDFFTYQTSLDCGL